jgi:hypothetical protein
MKIVEDLKIGEKVYYVKNLDVTWFYYQGEHINNKGHHILIDEYQEPFRIYRPQLVKILEEATSNYDDAKKLLIDRLREKALFWENIDKR